MIKKSFDELIEELMDREREGVENQSLAIQLNSSGGRCVECDKRIKKSHKSWEWLVGSLTLRMHLSCFTGWFARIVPDAEQAMKNLGDGHGK